MWPLDYARHHSYCGVLFGQCVSLIFEPLQLFSLIFCLHISVYQIFSVLSVPRSGTKLPPSLEFCHVTSYFSSAPVSPEDDTQNFLGHLLSWDQLLKTASAKLWLC